MSRRSSTPHQGARLRHTPSMKRMRQPRMAPSRWTSIARTRSPRSWPVLCRLLPRRRELPTVRARFQNAYAPGEILGAGEWRGTPATVWRNVVFQPSSTGRFTIFLCCSRAAAWHRVDFIYVADT